MDLAQRYEIAAIIKNCVPWVSQYTMEFALHCSAPHFDAVYWLSLAETWKIPSLQVACMAVVADEIAFSSAVTGYWSKFDSTKLAKVNPRIFLVISLAVAEGCTKNMLNLDVKERMQNFQKMIEGYLAQNMI